MGNSREGNRPPEHRRWADEEIQEPRPHDMGIRDTGEGSTPGFGVRHNPTRDEITGGRGMPRRTSPGHGDEWYEQSDEFSRRDPRRDRRRGFMDRAQDEIAAWFGNASAERRREDDHRGKGPRGYRRSDARIEEDVNDRLTDDPGVDATDIAVTVQEGEVTLGGTISSKLAKRRAEDCADEVSGVTHVQNNLRVRREDDASPD